MPQQDYRALFASIPRRHIRRSRPVVAASDLDAQESINEIVKTANAEGTIIPIAYGPVQLGGGVYALHYNKAGRQWTVGYRLALGELNSLGTVYANSVDASTLGLTFINKYVGANNQLVDPILKAAIESGGGPTYSDDLVISDPNGDLGVAHVVLQFDDETLPQWPDIVVEAEGRKCYDPRITSTVYTENPALFLADYLSNDQYGLGLTVNQQSIEDAADYCDDTSGISPSEVRRKGFVVFSQRQTAEQRIEILRQMAACWVVRRGNEIVLVSDKPGSSVRSFVASDVIEGSLRISKKDSTDLPTVMRARFTDTTGSGVWKEAISDAVKASGVDAGSTPWRESVVMLPGVNRHSQAMREVTERIDKLSLADLSVTFETFDEALKLEEGDIFSLTHPLGLSGKEFRIVNPPVEVRPGRWRIIGYEYSNLAYDNTVDAGTPIPDSVLPNGGTPSAPDTVTPVAEWFQTDDDVWKSRFRISWTAPADLSAVSHYFVTVRKQSGGATVFDTMVDGNVFETATNALEENITYEIEVRAEFAGVMSPANVQAVALTNNNVAPGTPTGVSGSSRAGIVYLDWDAIPNAKYYAIRHNIDGGNWSSAVIVDNKFSGTQLAIDCSSPPYPGTIRRFMVRAYDSVDNESNFGETDIQVTDPASGITIFYEDLANIPTSNAVGDIWYRTDTDNRPYYAESAGASTIAPGEWVLQSDTLQQKVDLAYIALVNTVQVTAFSANIQNKYRVDTEDDPDTVLEIQLPNNPVDGATIIFHDVNGYFDANPPLLKRGTHSTHGTHKIMEEADDVLLDHPRFGSFSFQYWETINSWQLT